MTSQQAPAGRFPSLTFFTILLVAILALTAYSFMMPGGFKTMDDQFSIVNNDEIKDLSHLKEIFRAGFFNDRSYYRPLVSLSFMLEHRFFGLNPFFYNLDNVLLHIFNAVLIFFIITIIFQNKMMGAFTSLLFAVHPVHWEAVSNISGRAVVLAVFFQLGAFLFFCLSSKSPRQKIFYAASIFFFALSLLCKESAVILPAIVFAYQFFLGEKSSRRISKALFALLPFFTVILCYVALRKFLGITEIYQWDSPKDATLSFITFLRAVLVDIRILIFPVDLHFDRSIALLKSFFDPEALFTLAVWILSGILLLRLWKKVRPEIIFFIAWFFIGLLPVSQIFPISVQAGYLSMAEHFLYGPSIAACALLALLFQWFYRARVERGLFSKNIFRAAAAGLYLFFFCLLVQQNIYAANEMSMFQETLKYRPDNIRINNSLGLSYAQKRLFKEAEWHFRKSLNQNPFDPFARISLGKVLCDQGRFNEGVEEYEKVVDSGKYRELLENNLRLTYVILVEKYKKRLAEDPSNARMHYSLGVIFSKSQRIDEAIEEYHRAVEIDPFLENACFNLVTSYTILDRLPEAALYFEKLIAFNKSDEKTTLALQSYLDVIHEKMGDKNKAQ